MDNVTHFKIKKGQSNFRPFESPLPIFGAKGYEARIKMVRGGWSSLEDWGGDKDWMDWQKGVGLTSFFSKNNQDSSFIAFSFGKEEETYNFAPYTNFPKEKIIFPKNKIVVSAGEWLDVKVTLEKSKLYYYLSTENDFIYEVHDFKKNFGITRRVGTFAGGANNSEGEHGGVAFKDMEMLVSFNVLR